MAKQQKWYTQQNAHGASSKFGQLIGEAFERAVFQFIATYLRANYTNYRLLEPEKGKRVVRLEMFGGTKRQLDNVITTANSEQPVALFESKWLKDARHHNDKGAWILQLRELRKKYPTVRGAVANLAGYWTEGVGVMFESEAGVRMVLVATDTEVYQSLQEHVDAFCERQGLEGMRLDAVTIRKSLPRSWDMANCLVEMKDNGKLDEIARQWLHFARRTGESGVPEDGAALIQTAIDEILAPLPEEPKIKRFEIALQIDTGNTIYQEFEDAEEALAFIQEYFRNPRAILKKITPKSRESDDD